MEFTLSAAAKRPLWSRACQPALVDAGLVRPFLQLIAAM
jgi:hypothetical protein